MDSSDRNSNKIDTDIEQLLRIREGEQEAFEKLYKAHYLQLARFSWRYVKSKAVAEELVQELFADLWQDRENIPLEGSIRAYLYKAIRNRSLNHLKHKNVARKYNNEWVEENTEEHMTIQYEDHSNKKKERVQEELKKSIETLDPKIKTTFKMHRFDGLTYKEIADILDVSVKTVEYRMTKALKLLRSKLSHLIALLLLIAN